MIWLYIGLGWAACCISFVVGCAWAARRTDEIAERYAELHDQSLARETRWQHLVTDLLVLVEEEAAPIDWSVIGG